MVVIFQKGKISASGPLLFPYSQRFPDLVQTTSFVQLCEIEIPQDPLRRVRIAAFPDSVTFGTDSAGAPLVYQPASFRIRGLRENTEGSIPVAQLTIGNVNLEASRLVQEFQGLTGQPVRYMLIDLADAPNGDPLIKQDFEILSCEVSDRAFVARIGQYNPFQSNFPANRHSIDGCRFRYKSARCGYSGALASCDHTLRGANGCIVHENQERFGAKPGIPRVLGLGSR